MPFRLSGIEILAVLFIIVLVFGPGRIGKVAGELGKGIKAFKDGLSEKDGSSGGDAGDGKSN